MGLGERNQGERQDVPASMKRDKAYGTILAELDVQWSHVCLECQSRCGILGAQVIEGGAVCELRPGDDVSVVRQFCGIPRSEAVRIAVIAALASVCVVGKGAVEVHFFAWIILVDVYAVTSILVAAVLYRVDAACGGVFSDSDAVSETPS